MLSDQRAKIDDVLKHTRNKLHKFDHYYSMADNSSNRYDSNNTMQYTDNDQLY